MASGNVVVVVSVDTTQAQQQLRLLRLCLWLDALPGRIRRWLSDLVPVRRGALRRAVAERDQTRAMVAYLHLRYWDLLAMPHRTELSGKN